LINKKIEEKLFENFNSAKKLRFMFSPKEFIKNTEALEYKNNLYTFLETSFIIDKISFLETNLYEEPFDVRWKMKDKKINLYWILNMKKEEFMAVAIHEFAHFIDLYYLEKQVTKDISNYFYDISWEETKVLKAWSKQSDFVSGYSMTNKYEDFAESFTYYILHNDEFIQKSKKSKTLKEKYDFISKYLFRKNEFKTKEYLTNKEIKEYYRDITKIPFSLDKFLEYLR